MGKRLLFGVLFLVVGFVTFGQTPSTQASNTAISYKYNGGAATITWTRGSGSNCIVVLRKSSSSYAAPPSSTSTNYTANASYGSGSSLGGGDNYVIYSGTGTSVYCYNLPANTPFYVYVYERNSLTIFGSTTYYYNTSVTTGSYEYWYSLDTEPSTNPTNLSVSSVSYTSAYLSCTPGNGDGRMFTIQQNYTGTTNNDPVDGNYYAPTTTFGSGAFISNCYVVYATNGTGATITNLLPATNYYYEAIEYGAGTQPTSTSYALNTRNYFTSSEPGLAFSTLNNPPTLNAISNITVCENSGQSYVSLSGITDGSSLENQTTTVTATSSNTTLIPNGNIYVSYASPNTTGYLYFTPAANQYGSATITVTVNDGWSSANTVSKVFIITVSPFPSAAGAISGTTTICQTSTGTVYSVPAITNATAYTWSLPSGMTITGGAGTNTITVSANSSLTTGNITVYGTNGNGCGNGASSTKVINLDKNPTPSSAGADQIICSGTTQLQGNNPAIGTGAWTLIGGSASFNNATQYNTNITGIANGQTATAVWSVSNGVCPTSKDTVSVTYNSAAIQCQIYSDFYVDNATPCTGSNVTFSDNSVGATSWSWNFGAGATPPTATGAGPHSVSYSSTGLKTVTLNVTGPNGSDNETKSNYINVVTTPSAAGAITGVSPVCAGAAQVLYSVGAISGADTYNWTASSGYNINTGNGTSSVSVNYSNTATTGTITVQGQNACGTGTASTYTVTVNPLPGTPSVIAGNDTVCQGQSGEMYAVSPITNVTGYNWSTPPGANITVNNNNQITLDYNTSALSGTMAVFGSNACGNGDTALIMVVVNPLPLDPGTITGSTYLTRCPAANAGYSVAADINTTFYNWILPQGGSISSGSGSANITADFTPLALDGNVGVIAGNGCGLSDTTFLAVSFEPMPDVTLCAVTVDTASMYNEIHWTRPMFDKIHYFNIYRRLTALVDTLVDSVLYNNPTEVVDMLAGYDPNTTSYEYTISLVDSCGFEYPKAPYHQTMFLQTSLGPGTVNLSWNLYVGQTVNFYRVYRDTTGLGNWELLTGSVPPTSVAWTDNNPPTGVANLRYLVDVDWLTTCDPSRGAINTSRSNIKTSTFVGVKENKIDDKALSIYPNPAHDLLNIELNQQLSNVVVTIYDAIGKLVFSEKPLSANRILISTESFAKGVYTVTINSDKGRVAKKLIIE